MVKCCCSTENEILIHYFRSSVTSLFSLKLLMDLLCSMRMETKKPIFSSALFLKLMLNLKQMLDSHKIYRIRAQIIIGNKMHYYV